MKFNHLKPSVQNITHFHFALLHGSVSGIFSLRVKTGERQASPYLQERVPLYNYSTGLCVLVKHMAEDGRYKTKVTGQSRVRFRG